MNVLVVVLLLIVAAAGVLATAVLTGQSWWGWISVGLSVLAALMLVFARHGGRHGRHAGAGASSDDDSSNVETQEVVGLSPDSDSDTGADEDAAAMGSESSDQAEDDASATTAVVDSDSATGSTAAGCTVASSAAADPESSAAQRADAVATIEAEDEPPEEDTDAADVLITAESEAPVFVIDERPRYHGDDCGWVGQRETIELPVCEARMLGFTPCRFCGPDATLAEHERERATR